MSAQPDDPSTLIAQAREALEVGNKADARQFLAQLIRQDRRNEQAWIYLAKSASTDTERQESLEHVLTINPHNAEAKKLRDQLLTKSPDAEGQANHDDVALLQLQADELRDRIYQRQVTISELEAEVLEQEIIAAKRRQQRDELQSELQELEEKSAACQAAFSQLEERAQILADENRRGEYALRELEAAAARHEELINKRQTHLLELEAEVRQHEERLPLLRQETGNLHSWLSRRRGTLAELEDTLAERERLFVEREARTNELRSQGQSLETQIEKRQAHINRLQTEADELQQEITRRKSAVAAWLESL